MEDAYLDSYWEDQYEMQAPYDDRDYLPDDGDGVDPDEEEEGVDEYEARQARLEDAARWPY